MEGYAPSAGSNIELGMPLMTLLPVVLSHWKIGRLGLNPGAKINSDCLSMDRMLLCNSPPQTNFVTPFLCHVPPFHVLHTKPLSNYVVHVLYIWAIS